MDRRKYLRAYVRTDKRGKITPGSLTLLNKLPRTPGFKEVTNPGVNACACAGCNAPNVIHYKYQDAPGGYNPYIAGIYSDIDADCNTYFLHKIIPPYAPVGEGEDGVSCLLKRNAQGDILWQVQFTTPISYNGTDFYPYKTIVDNTNKKLFICSYYHVLCLDLDGNLLWSKYMNIDSLGFSTGGFADIEGMALTPDGAYLYIGGLYNINEGLYYNRYGWMVKMDASNGNILIEKLLDNGPIAANKFQSIYGITISEQGGIFAGFNGGLGQFPGHLIRFDDSLNIVWQTALAPAGQYNYQDTPTVDYEGNVVMWWGLGGTPFTRASLKIDGNTGAPIWLVETNNITYNPGSWDIYDYRFDADNNIYGVASSFADGYQIFKFTKDGDNIFTYRVKNSLASFNNTYWGSTAVVGPNVTQGNLLFPAFSISNLTPPYTATLYEFKLPLEPIVGTYGDFTFTNDTLDYSFIKSVPTFAPSAGLINTPSTLISDVWEVYPITLSSVANTFLDQPL